jgi:ring-1,2-phenylacetyl-CoA epoxidase subunit PaaD
MVNAVGLDVQAEKLDEMGESVRLAHLAHIEAILSTVPDPEIPVVSIRELGILRDVRVSAQGVEVIITPTYSGCPAMEQIRDDVVATLACHQIKATVTLQLSPAWTTDWMTPAARDKLRAYGIAPPHVRGNLPASEGANRQVISQVIRFAPKSIASHAHDTRARGLFDLKTPVNCPQCGSANTTETSHFGSTACKALYKCLSCLEPFDYFKPY